MSFVNKLIELSITSWYVNPKLASSEVFANAGIIKTIFPI